MIELLLFFLLVAMLATSAFLSGSETALFSLSSTKVGLFSQSKNKAERSIAFLLSTPQDLLITILMLNVTVNILIQNLFSSILGSHSGWMTTTLLPLVLVLLFGEAIPKSMGLIRSEAIAKKVVKPLTWICLFLTPFRLLFSFITRFLSKHLFFFLKKEKQISLEELKYMLHHSRSAGVIERSELQFLCGYLELGDRTVRELMRPRVEILAYDVSEPIEKLIYLFVDEQCSKIPVFKDSIDQVLGIVSAHHFLLHRELIQSSKDLTPYLRKPLFVPEALIAHRLLHRFEELEEKIALVIDDYGSIVGLVTREDLMELLVGQIEDKRDEKADYTKVSSNAILASAFMEIKELEDLWSIDLINPEHLATVGGWMIDRMEKIPKVGEIYEDQQLSIQVLTAHPHRLETLYIQRKEAKR